jgi:hypothetical protein
MDPVNGELFDMLLKEAFSMDPVFKYKSIVGQQSFPQFESKWTSKGILDGILISTNSLQNIHKARGIKAVDYSAKRVYDVVQSISETTGKIDKMFRHGRVLKTLPTNDGTAAELLYARYRIPPFSDRDFIFAERRNKFDIVISENGTEKILQSVYVIVVKDIQTEELQSHNFADIPANGWSCVRGEMLCSGWVIVPLNENKCEVRYVVQVDPKVWLPSFIVNFFAYEQPLLIKSVESYLKQC